MEFSAELQQDGKTATGITVPEDVLAALGGGHRPAVAGAVNRPTFPPTNRRPRGARQGAGGGRGGGPGWPPGGGAPSPPPLGGWGPPPPPPATPAARRSRRPRPCPWRRVPRPRRTRQPRAGTRTRWRSGARA